MEVHLWRARYENATKAIKEDESGALFDARVTIKSGGPTATGEREVVDKQKRRVVRKSVGCL